MSVTVFGQEMPRLVNDVSYTILCSCSAGNNASWVPSRHGVRSPMMSDAFSCSGGVPAGSELLDW